MPTREKTQLLSAAQTGRTIQRLGHEIVEKTGEANGIALIGIRRRGVPLAQRLAPTIRTATGAEVPIGILDITLYRDDLSLVTAHPVVQATDIPFSVDGRDIILVDDVLYTGRTIRAAMNGLFDLGRPRRIQLCVLVDRGHRELPVEATYVGRKVDTRADEVVEVHLKEIDGEDRVLVLELVHAP
ncbi:MAG TPA: bifunctional pyr operon transcriptional regulator/uracil phosphoribosyltransferase PyrR [Candidatus Acidoferrales bacterium]|nr:bifunctional pyr operon transcriptional regulator/uracil phosphoribosyltransferase PyrR [Candidatus Acidoferrales bacterium]